MVLKMGPLEDHDHYDEVPMIGLLIFIRRGNEREKHCLLLVLCCLGTLSERILSQRSYHCGFLGLAL